MSDNLNQIKGLTHYIVNKKAQENGVHEVHRFPKFYCDNPSYPSSDDREDLGYYDDCFKALARAVRVGYKTADGCSYCSKPCHIKKAEE